MVGFLYALIGRTIYWLSSPLLFLVSLKAHARVRVIIINSKNEVLLVRNWYGRQRWALPGGGVRHREPTVRAAQREIREELSLDLREQDLMPVGSLQKYDATTPFEVDVFSAELSSESAMHRQPFEIIDARWCKLSDLPEPLHPSVRQALDLWRP